MISHSSIKDLLTLATEYQINVVIDYYQATTLYTGGGYSLYNMNEFTTMRNYISMKYQNNENSSSFYFGNDAFGSVKFLTSLKMLINDIESHIKLKSLPQLP
ncbi:MAG: hypothetical protein LBF12_07770 [Christensenellaceae bacterium]|jgi:hypothetical protein|nr:hypothetical protein [Christensenellaceae bacterium]